MSFIRAGSASELAEGSAIKVEIDGRPLAVVKAEGGRIYAVDDTCTHEDASLSEGYVEGMTIECPHHGATFDLETGEALSLPAIGKLATYAVKVENGDILVNINESKTEQ